MNKRYQKAIFIDTEFIFARNYKQPIQISFIAYSIVGNNFIYDKSYSTYILLENGVKLNKYVTKFTGIDESTLNKYGILTKQASIQLLEFLEEFTLANTLLIGWDVSNDIIMLNHLLNNQEQLFNIGAFTWYDMVAPYKNLYDTSNPNTPSLVSACQKLGIENINFHDSYQDALATQKVMQHMALEKGLGLLLNPRFISTRQEKTKKKVHA